MTDDFIFEDEPGSRASQWGVAPGDSATTDEAGEAVAGVASIGELKPVAELLRALARTVKVTRLYPENNPMVARAVDELAERFTAAFQQHDSLRLLIGRNRIDFQGETVYDSSDPEESVARHLFRDGIRELAFHIGFDRAELGSFLGLYRRALSRDEPEDLVTLLWDVPLAHVTYIAVDEMLDVDADGDALPEEFGSERMTSLDFELLEPEEDGPDSEAARQAAVAASEMQKKLRGAGESAILSLSPEETRELAAEVSGEDPDRLARRVLDTLFEVIGLDGEPATREPILAALGRALTSLAARRQFGAAAHILKRLDRAMVRDPELARLNSGSVQLVQRAALDAAQLDLVAEILEKGTPSELQEIDEYLLSLPAGSVEILIDLLGRVTHPRARRQLTEALERSGRPAAFLLAAHLNDERPQFVLSLLQVLGRLNEPATVRLIRPITLHADVRVRQEALATLTRMGETEARQALINALRDTDPRLRASAARTLGGLGTAGVNPLLQVVLARDFEGRRLDERRAFFDALGQTDSPEILPFLKHLLDKKPLFNKEKAEEMRICAVEALARMTLREAGALMAQALQDPSSRVRGAAASSSRRRAGGEHNAQEVAGAA